jgi:hypothetical protein
MDSRGGSTTLQTCYRRCDGRAVARPRGGLHRDSCEESAGAGMQIASATKRSMAVARMVRIEPSRGPQGDASSASLPVLPAQFCNDGAVYFSMGRA